MPDPDDASDPARASAEMTAASRFLRLTRETLYELVWAEPVARLAKRWGVSDVAVAKWCRKLNVPRPGRGYWARVQAGHKGGKRPLPPARAGQLHDLVPGGPGKPAHGRAPKVLPPSLPLVMGYYHLSAKPLPHQHLRTVPCLSASVFGGRPVATRACPVARVTTPPIDPAHRFRFIPDTNSDGHRQTVRLPPG